MPTAAQLTPLLAGTQCTQCGYPSCVAYAEAMAGQGAAPNLCRPGGAHVSHMLAEALGQPGQQPAKIPLPPHIAYVNESNCIGCTLCLQKCPTSAIVGAPKQLHTVVVSDCTGCNLCVPVCPTQCITLEPAPARHKLTQQLADGSLNPAATAKIWSLVHATESRATTTPRAIKDTPQVSPTVISGLSPELLAKVSAARTKSAEKYASKGPLRTPTALKNKS